MCVGKDVITFISTVCDQKYGVTDIGTPHHVYRGACFIGITARLNDGICINTVFQIMLVVILFSFFPYTLFFLFLFFHRFYRYFRHILSKVNMNKFKIISLTMTLLCRTTKKNMHPRRRIFILLDTALQLC